ncbi:MAG: efflux RND transporter periplasmic adaptor subunit [Pseudomonadales bacterium]
MTSADPAARDRGELLKSLKIDRGPPPPGGGGRPLKWFLLLAVAFGIGFVVWFAPLRPGGDVEGISVSVARVQAAESDDASGSVLDATGYVVARRQATVSAKTTGKVVEVLIEEGDRVEAGQVLAVLDDSIPRAQLALAESQLQSARAGLEELRVSLKQAELDLERTRGLAERNLASQADLDRDGLTVDALVARLERAGKDVEVAQKSLAVQAELLRDMEIRAPFAGIVVAKAAQPGEMISPVSAGGGFTRTGICTIVDMDSLEVEVDVNEAYINRVEDGQSVQVTLNAYPQDHYAARVIAIIPTADRNKATVRVRVGFVDRDERVLPDMGVRVAFLESGTGPRAAEAESAVLVPRSAIGSDEAGDYVLLVREDQVRRRSVVAGAVSGSRIRVLDGLSGGELLVADLTSGPQSGLRDGDRVSVIN